MKCGLCWADNPDDASFCSDCGVMLSPQTVANVPTMAPVEPVAGRRVLPIVSTLAIVATLALVALIIWAIAGGNDGADRSPSAAPTVAATEPSTTTEPPAAVEVDPAVSAWRGFSATFVQMHSTLPFTSGGLRYALATVEDVTARQSSDTSGLVLLGWVDDQWKTIAGIPWKSPAAEVSARVLGDSSVAHPMVVLDRNSAGTTTSYVFRVFDDRLLDIVTGRSIDDTWTPLSLGDVGPDHLEFSSCKSGATIALESGATQFFCDVSVNSRLEVLADESVRSTSAEVVNERPAVAVPNDLGIVGAEITRPACDGSYITAVGASISSSEPRNRINIARLLRRYPGSSYLRNDQTCDSLWPSAKGVPIYIVYFGPFATKAEACDARDLGPAGAYVRPLDDGVAYTTKVHC